MGSGTEMPMPTLRQIAQVLQDCFFTCKKGAQAAWIIPTTGLGRQT